jgi:hypothetical protein
MQFIYEIHIKTSKERMSEVNNEMDDDQSWFVDMFTIQWANPSPIVDLESVFSLIWISDNVDL